MIQTGIWVCLLYIITAIVEKGPRFTLPLVGHLLQFRSLVSKFGYFHLAWTEIGRQYGPVAKIRLGKDDIVVLNGFEAIKNALMLKDCDGRPDGFMWRLRTYEQHMGIIVTDGPIWKVERSFFVVQMRNSGLRGSALETKVHFEMEAFIKHIQENCSKPGGSEMELHNFCYVSVINILWSVVAGQRFGYSDEGLHTLMKLLNGYMKALDMTGGIINQMPILRFIFPELTGFNKINTAITKLNNYLEEIVEEHKNTIEEGLERDLIDSYLTKTKREGQLCGDNRALVSLLSDLFIAGSETTANTLSYCLLLMLHHPEIQTEAQRHIDLVVGRDRLPTLADRAELTYIDAVIMETQRFSGIVPVCVAHRALRTCEVLNHKIPKDTMLVPNLSSVLMDVDYWGDPEVFRPERFLNGGKLVEEERLIPFGLGKRRCPGEPLARTSLFLILSSLLQNFRFDAVPDQLTALPSLLPVDGITLSPKPFNGIVTVR